MQLGMMAYDFGASSGRAILGQWNGERLTLSELHRFSNDPVMMGDTLYWDAPRLLFEVQAALEKAGAQGGVSSVGIDTWGVDFGLIDAGGRLMANPVHYRDVRTDGVMEEAFATVSKQDIYARTGLALLQFNTLYQLLALKKQDADALNRARALLFMPDLFAYFLTGEMAAEYTIASTSQMIDPVSRNWDYGLLKAFGLPAKPLLPIQMPGSVRGKLLPSVQKLSGLAGIPVINVGSHDTASAVAAVPATEGNFAYISSGTWSLIGTETDSPVRTPEALAANLTNEGGVGGKIRLLKNVMGLWIIQECRREWAKENPTLDFAEIVTLAAQAKPFVAAIDPDEGRFLYPGDMPEKIRAYCRETGQTPPEGIAQIARVIFESLAMKYRWTLERLTEACGNSFSAIHVVGGGSKNALLNQLTADCAGMPVLSGPSEATAIGNLLMQAIALGEISSLQQARDAVRRSFEPEVFTPQNASRFSEPYAKFVSEVVRG